MHLAHLISETLSRKLRKRAIRQRLSAKCVLAVRLPARRRCRRGCRGSQGFLRRGAGEAGHTLSNGRVAA